MSTSKININSSGKKAFDSVVVVLIAVVLPLIGKPMLILTWPAISIGLIGLFILFTQPPIPTREEIRQNQTKDRNTAIALVLTSILCYQITLIDSAYLNQYFPIFNNGYTWLGLGLMVASMLFRWYVIRYLGRFFTAQVTIFKDHQLITSGPYRILRHPSYTASSMALVGVAILFQSYISLLFFILVFMPVLLFRIKIEEKALFEQFGEQYHSYSARSWRLFPWLY